MLGEIYNGLLDFVIHEGGPDVDQALDQISLLCTVATEQVKTVQQETATSRETDKNSGSTKFELKVASQAPSFTVSDGSEESREQESGATYRFEYSDKVIFPSVSSTIKTVLGLYKAQLYILLDEWSSLPLDVQPYFAEFIKRSFLPLSNVAVKIGSLEYRSEFGVNTPNGLIGFEMGADISAFLDIDDYYVYDRNPEGVTEAFSNILVKHLSNELPDGYLAGLGIPTGAKLASKLFTEKKVFQELVRASEGVARDLINIFSKAYFVALRRSKDKIERDAVLEAARQWFEQDKERNLSDPLRAVLRRITDEVIGSKRARSFLIPRELAGHATIQHLLDLRVLHLVQRGYADKDKPGVRYNIYALDYGTYVDLMNTSKKPDLGFEEIKELESTEYIVPFDDKRSIRRIILTEATLVGATLS